MRAERAILGTLLGGRAADRDGLRLLAVVILIVVSGTGDEPGGLDELGAARLEKCLDAPGRRFPAVMRGQVASRP